MLASLVLGTRYRPRYVFAGVAAAFTLHVALAVAVGSALGLLPRTWLDVGVGVVFLVGAVVLLHGRSGGRESGEASAAREGSFLRAATAGFAVVGLAEFGDITQIIVANLAARYHEPAAVGVGSVLALWTAAAAAILGGRGLLRVVPVSLVGRAAGVAMAALGIFTIVTALAR